MFVHVGDKFRQFSFGFGVERPSVARDLAAIAGPLRVTRVLPIVPGVKPFDRLAVRGALILVAVALLFVGVNFLFRSHLAIALWPWTDGPLSFLFVSSIVLAEGATMAWFAWSLELSAARGGALGFALMNGGIAVFTASLSAGPGRPGPLLLGWAVTTGLLALGGVALFFFGPHFPRQDTRPSPALVRLSFLVFALALFAITFMLLARFPIVFPWKLKPESSTMFGFLFLASACYFLDGFLRPGVANAAGQLLGFFVYDAILIPPYLRHWPKTAGGFRVSLTIYLVFLFGSAALAVWFWLRLRGAHRAGP